MNRFWSTALALMLATSSGFVRAEQAGDLTVTATYKGKGVVDDTHEIYVFLFDSPTVGPGMRPIGWDAIRKNGGSVTFKNFTGTVYVATAYDESGSYDPQTGPPVGLPIGLHSKDGKAMTPVTIAPGAKVTMAFNDAVRFQQ